MLRNELAFGLGIAAGVIVAGAVAYYFYTKNKNKVTESESERKFAEKLEKQNFIEEFIAGQTYVDTLTSKELTSWFRENRDKYPKNAKMIISTTETEIAKSLGLSEADGINTKTSVIQMFYDDVTEKILKSRLVGYAEIESNLQAHLIENNGIIVVTD